VLTAGAALVCACLATIAAESGRRVIAVPMDTGSDASVATGVAEVALQLGGIDIVINAAAEPNQGGFSEETLESELNVKLRGYLRVIRAAVPHMDGWGRVINISGLAARQAGSIVGSVRNVAVAAMTKNLADELGPQGINVTVVHPGATVTARTPPDSLIAGVSIGRLVTAAEVADVVCFLASPRSVAINGDAIPAGGGAIGPIHY
jgi:NAD(P)-dependent dehydrogenase (short-subunit alcohol dehydrogenase family)